MNEIAIMNYFKGAKEAKRIYYSLRELYGDDMENHKLLRRAYIDGVITAQELQLLQDYAMG